MPTLPSYNSQQNIQPQQQAPLRNEAEKPFKDNAQVLSSLQDTHDAWNQARDTMQYTEAKAKHGLLITDIQTRAANDPDFKNSDKYYKELQKANKDSILGITNPNVASKAQVEFGFDAGLAQIKMQDQFRQKELATYKVNLKTSVDVDLQKMLSAPVGSQEAQLYKANYEKTINDGIAKGILSPQEASKILSESQKTSVQYEIYNDNATQEKDSNILSELRNPNGKYSFLPPDTRLDLIQESQRRIFQNNQTFKREADVSRDQRFNDLFTKQNEGTLTLNDLDAQMAIPEESGGIPKRQLLDIREGIQRRVDSDIKRIIKSEPEAKKYLKFVDSFVSDETDRQKGREAIASAFKDGIISSQEASLLNSLKRETEDIQWAKTKDAMAPNNLIPFKNAYFAVVDWFRGSGRHNEPEAAMAIKKLLNGASKGQDLDSVVQQVLREDRVNAVPEIKTFPTKGQRMIDPVSGVTAIVYPDGTIEVENGGVQRKPSNTSK